MASSKTFSGSPPDPLSGEEASEVLGSISMAAFLCLLLPQLYANYKLQSADSLSMAFLFVWLVGDISNLLGGIINHIAPASLAVSAYLCFSDSTLICQCLYYNAIRRKDLRSATTGTTASQTREQQPLLAAHNASATRASSDAQIELARDPSQETKRTSDAVHSIHDWRTNFACIIGVHFLGVMGWVVLNKTGVLGSERGLDGVSVGMTIGLSEVGTGLGYFGALCYLFARVPQIIKNYRQRSCEGLAPLFLLLSITGNLMYGLSVIAYNQDRDYLLTSLPWLLGSLGTILEDCFILLQVKLYQKRAGGEADEDR